MDVLVTGGAGFIGRWVVDALLRRGDQVTVLDDLSNGSLSNIAAFRSHRRFRFLRGDVADPRAVQSAFRRGFELCLHLAARVEVQRSLDDPRDAYRANVEGTMQVLEACRRNDVRLALMSTCMVYDAAKARGAIGEDHPVKPASPYAATKLAAEHLALSYYHGYGLPVTVLRPFNTYGPFQKANQEGGVVAIFVRRAMKGLPLRIFGTGRQTRDFLYVGDCVDFLLRAADARRAAGEVFNAGSGDDVTILELARLVAGPRGRVVQAPHPHPKSEIPRLRCDASKARRVLGWAPKVRLTQGITRVREWMGA